MLIGALSNAARRCRCCHNRRVHRHRGARRLTSWLFVAALLLKSAVPMLASAAAGLQGKATAEVCDVYGVALPARDPQGHADHHAHHAHGDASASTGDPAPSHGPASRVSHGGDHCALSARARRRFLGARRAAGGARARRAGRHGRHVAGRPGGALGRAAPARPAGFLLIALSPPR
jgi:hypothetical protein